MKIQNRINNPQKIDVIEIEKEINNGKHVIVQFSEESYSDLILSELDNLCKKYDQSFGVRFYGHYSNAFDFNHLKKIPNVKCLYVDCLTDVVNFDALSELQYLEKLSVGYYNLKQTEFLDFDNLKKVKELYLTDTKTKALNLEYLRDYKSLKFLILGGHTKNIDKVGSLTGLETLYLNSIKKISISFINNLKELKTLRFILGGRENIQEIDKNIIENLEITRVKGFKDLGNISSFKNLKTLSIEDNIKLEELDFNVEFPNLTDLKIINCKSFSSLSGLSNLSSLKSLVIYKTDLNFDTVIKNSLPQSLETFVFCTTRNKEDKVIKDRISELGYETR